MWTSSHQGLWTVLLAVAMLAGLFGSGCGSGAGADPLKDPRIEKAVEDVRTGKENPRKLRNLINEKVTGKEYHEKIIPKSVGRSRRSR